MLSVLLFAITLNHQLTPGVARPLTKAAICSTAWGRDRRHVTERMKRAVAARYGVPWSDHANYEFDHLIPRELGGADVIDNLWPQPWADARTKDREENRLHKAVCANQMSLKAAQQRMRAWKDVAAVDEKLAVLESAAQALTKDVESAYVLLLKLGLVREL